MRTDQFSHSWSCERNHDQQPGTQLNELRLSRELEVGRDTISPNPLPRKCQEKKERESIAINVIEFLYENFDINISHELNNRRSLCVSNFKSLDRCYHCHRWPRERCVPNTKSDNG